MFYLKNYIHEQYTPNQGVTYLIFRETSPHLLEPNFNIYRDSYSSASLSVLKDIYNTDIPIGDYYISFYVDTLNIVEESNDFNNSSMSFDKLYISSTTGAKSTAVKNSKKSGRAFNGRKISSSKVATKKVKITINADGQKVIRVVEENVKFNKVARTRKASAELKLSVDEENNVSKVLTKKMESKNKRIFPTSTSKAMPEIE